MNNILQFNTTIFCEQRQLSLRALLDDFLLVMTRLCLSWVEVQSESQQLRWVFFFCFF